MCACWSTVDNCIRDTVQLIIVYWRSTVNNGGTGRAAGGQAAACTVDSSSSFLQDGRPAPSPSSVYKMQRFQSPTIADFSFFPDSGCKSKTTISLRRGGGFSTVKVCGTSDHLPVVSRKQTTCQNSPASVRLLRGVLENRRKDFWWLHQALGHL